jgi:hypothetical protein
VQKAIAAGKMEGKVALKDGKVVYMLRLDFNYYNEFKKSYYVQEMCMKKRHMHTTFMSGILSYPLDLVLELLDN